MKKTIIINLVVGIFLLAISVAITNFLAEKAGYQKGFEEGKKEGFQYGFQEGVKEGEKYSILRFVERIYREDLFEMERALSLTKEVKTDETKRRLRSSVQATVENVKTWRSVDEDFKEFLDGEIDALESAVRRDDYEKMEEIILILLQTYEGKRLAIERELEKINP